MFPYLLLLFTVVPALELILIIRVGSHIGAINTVFLIIFTGILGASLARWQGFRVIQKIQHSLNTGVMPNKELFDGVFILVGGIVLLTPGFMTDLFGLLCLFPLTRRFMQDILQVYFDKMMREGRGAHFIHTNPSDKTYDDIDI